MPEPKMYYNAPGYDPEFGYTALNRYRQHMAMVVDKLKEDDLIIDRLMQEQIVDPEGAPKYLTKEYLEQIRTRHMLIAQVHATMAANYLREAFSAE